MEYICGKQTARLDRAGLFERLEPYPETWLDLGTGDGRYVAELARNNPRVFLLGIDACRENLVRVSRRARPNALFLIASAGQLPAELDGLAGRITLNFPWGSLLRGLLEEQSGVLKSLARVARAGTRLEIRLNDSALAQSGWTPEAGRARVAAALAGAGFRLKEEGRLDRAALRAFPSSWARRTGSGGEGQFLYFEYCPPGPPSSTGKPGVLARR